MARTSKLGRLVATVLSLAVAASVWVAGAAEVTTPKACCAAMHHDCGAVVIAQQCCAPAGSDTVALAPDTSQSRQRAVVAVAPPLAPALSTLAGSFRTAHTSPPRSPRTPTYLSDSVFRI